MPSNKLMKRPPRRSADRDAYIHSLREAYERGELELEVSAEDVPRRLLEVLFPCLIWPVQGVPGAWWAPHAGCRSA